MSQNPFAHTVVDPAGNEIFVASMPDDLLMASIHHYLVKKPEFDINQAKMRLLQGVADFDTDLTEEQAMTLGVRLPTDQERAEIEEKLKKDRLLIHNIALSEAMPYVLIGLVRESTQAEVAELVRNITGLAKAVEVHKYNRNVIDTYLLPPVLQVDEEIEEDL